MSKQSVHERFRIISNSVSKWAGSVWSFVVAFFVIVSWALCGPVFNFSDTWQLVINTSTTIITFLMVFIIQNTQNRQDKTLNLKIDEIILSLRKARNQFVNIECLSDAELKKLEVSLKDAIGNEKPRSRRARRRKKVKVLQDSV